MKIRKAVIPAAGLGIRFLPATKAIPKEMLPIVDKPTIQYIVEEAVASGIEEILIISGRNKSVILDHFDHYPYLEDHLRSKGKTDLLEILQETGNLAEITSIRQKEPKGLGHAIACAKSFVGKEPFAILLGDDIVDSPVPCLQQLMEVFAQTSASIIGVQEVELSQVSKYGILDAQPQSENLFKVQGLVEKPQPEQAPSRLAVMGRYIITPAIFEILEHTPPGSGGEIQLTDALQVLAQQEPMFGLIFAGIRYDVGDKLGYLKANLDFALKRPELTPSLKEYLADLQNG